MSSIGELAKFRAGIATDVINAIDGNGIKFKENGGTEVASISDTGACVLGPFAGGVQHNIYGKNGLGSALDSGLNLYSKSTGSSSNLALSFGTDFTNKKSWISAWQPEVGGCSLDFLSYTTNVGGYSSTGAWTFNHNDSGTGDLNHLTLQKQGSTRFQIGSNQSVGLTYQTSVTEYGHSFITGSSGTVGGYSALGAWTFGPATNTPYTSYHTVYKNLMSGQPSAATDAYGAFYVGANVFIASGRTPSKRTGISGACLSFSPSTLDTDGCFAVFVSPQARGDTIADIAASCDANCKWTFGKSGNNNNHVFNGSVQITDRTVSSSNVPAYFTSGGILSTVSSSIRYKKNIETLTPNTLTLVNNLRVVQFDYKAEANPCRKMVGLIAEEVDQVIPNMVVRTEQGEPDSVYYQDLPLYLVKAIQELSAKLDEANAKIAALEGRV